MAGKESRRTPSEVANGGQGQEIDHSTGTPHNDMRSVRQEQAEHRLLPTAGESATSAHTAVPQSYNDRFTLSGFMCTEADCRDTRCTMAVIFILLTLLT